MTPINEIRARLAADPIPEGARADWRDTNHYEISDPTPRHQYWWLCGTADIFARQENWSATLMGKRLGTCLDLACSWRPDITLLLAEIDRLTAEATVR